MMKKKSHPEFVRALKARNLKITVVGTYENCLSRVAVRCDVCGWEWAPVGGSLLRGHGCPKCAGTMRKSHAEFVEELKSRRDDVIIVGPYVKALEKTRFRFLKCGHEWDVTPAHILNGRGCPLCAHSRRGASQRLTMERFLKRLHKIDRNLVVREGGKYVNYTTPIPLRCNACKYEYEVKPSDFCTAAAVRTATGHAPPFRNSLSATPLSACSANRKSCRGTRLRQESNWTSAFPP